VLAFFSTDHDTMNTHLCIECHERFTSRDESAPFCPTCFATKLGDAVGRQASINAGDMTVAHDLDADEIERWRRARRRGNFSGVSY
jgi:hypothetical protein